MIINGIAHWAKVVGKPQPGYDKSVLEWSMDLEISKDVKKQLAKEGLGHKIKTSKDGEYEYISFKRKAVKTDGTPSKPIRIVAADGKTAWDDRKIGNGSNVNVSFVVNEVPYGGKTHKKPGIIAIQVLNLVPYEGGSQDEFEDYTSDGGHDDWSGETE